MLPDESTIRPRDRSLHRWVLAMVCAIFAGGAGAAGSAMPDVAQLQNRWDTINFSLPDDKKIAEFEKLEALAERYTEANPQDADGWTWSGIIRSSFAGKKGGLGALGLAKKARRDFETALEIDEQALHGSAHTSLGTLYFRVPGWPIGFGSDKKAEEHLQRGLEIDPDGMDSNYFYAEFLADQGKLDAARQYYLKARRADARPGRPIADEGRLREIEEALASLDDRTKTASR